MELTEDNQDFMDCRPPNPNNGVVKVDRIEAEIGKRKEARAARSAKHSHRIAAE